MATILSVSIALILITIGVHHEAPALGSRCLDRLPISPRIRVLLAVFLTLCAHFIEVVLFAVGWYYLLATNIVRPDRHPVFFADHVHLAGVRRHRAVGTGAAVGRY